MTAIGARRAAVEHHQWLSRYLRTWGLIGRVRLMMVALTFGCTVGALILLFGADGPRGGLPVAMTWLSVVGGAAGTILWIARWPSYTESLIYGVVTNTSIALACLAHPMPLAALVGCIAFAISGAYFAFFHSNRLVVYNFGVASAVAIFEAARLVGEGHLSLAVVDLMLILQINIAMPLAIWVLVRALRNDLLRADRDPLTGLLNRRGFFDETRRMLERANSRMFLVVMLVDLDKFKAINDTHGHHTGDQVLIAVARALHDAAPSTAVVARSGGEEFLVADTAATYPCAASVIAERICVALSTIRDDVTASVGIAYGVVREGRRLSQSSVNEVIASADAAMYCAKRAGGNRFYDSRPAHL